MAKFIAVSGPSASGKSSLFEELKFHQEISNVVFIPDIFKTVWDGLVAQGLFFEFEEVNKDAEFLCIFIQRMIDYYRDNIEHYKDTDKVVILDSCWVDLAIYSSLNMWYNHILKDVQESLLKQLTVYDDNLDRIYITSYDETKKQVEKYRSPFKRYNIKYNRPLEIQYYHMASNFKNAVALPTTDLSEAALFILDDLIELGYL